MNKRREKYYFTELCELLPEFSKGKFTHLDNNEDPPDFLLDLDGKHIGIELTEMMTLPINPSSFSPQKRSKFLRKIVDQTKKTFEKQCNRKLIADFSFTNPFLLKENEIEHYCNSLSMFIKKNIDDLDLREDEYTEISNNYPKNVQRLLVMEVPPTQNQYIWTDQSWFITDTFKIDNPTNTEIIQVIKRKEDKIENWKPCDYKILVIIMGGQIGSIFKDNYPTINIETTLFDQVLLLNIISKTIKKIIYF